MTDRYADENPPLHTVRVERIPETSWLPAAVQTLPPGLVNVRLWSRDDQSGREIYTVEPCPGIVHIESSVTEIVLAEADDAGNLWDENGEPYDPHPVVIDTVTADPPRLDRHYVDPAWLPGYLGGGYLGTCPADQVSRLLAEQGFADAIPRGTAS